MPCIISYPGSSPLTRGKLGVAEREFGAFGLIPAHAGKTPSRSRTWPNTQAHPRSRGENFDNVGKDIPFTGSSPLTRGKRLTTHRRRPFLGLIPAHAGKTSTRSSQSPKSRAHPRSRGENLGDEDTGVLEVGSSPLTRGKLRDEAQPEQSDGLIPAHAGKTSASTAWAR